MVKASQIVNSVREVVDREVEGIDMVFNKLVTRLKGIQPVSGKGHDVPGDEQPEEGSEFAPAALF